MIIRFQDRKQYEEWLKWESWGTREKARKFAEVYGDDILPIVLQIDAYTPQGGEWAPGYIFVHPQAQELLNFVIT